jgi:antitoxin component of MazEF toxin-antitoxin module
MASKSKHHVLGKAIRKVVRVGNSLALTIPPEYIKEHNIKKGDSFEICFDNVYHAEPLSIKEIQRKVEQQVHR